MAVDEGRIEGLTVGGERVVQTALAQPGDDERAGPADREPDPEAAGGVAAGHQRGTCRTCHPSSSGSMFVLAQDSAEMVTSADVEAGELVRIGDRFG